MINFILRVNRIGKPLSLVSYVYCIIYDLIIKKDELNLCVFLIEITKIRSLLIGGSSKLSFCEYRPCYVHDRTHVGTSDVAKCGTV